jgi:TonB family protein
MKFFSQIILAVLLVSISAFSAYGQNSPNTFQPSVSHWDSAKKEMIYEFAEVTPRFTGGDSAYTRFMQQNVKYPRPAFLFGIQGTVHLKILIRSDGQLDTNNIKVFGKADSMLIKEAIRAIKLSPRWVPGENGGKKVSSWVWLPIKFTLPAKETDPPKEEGK